MTGEVGVAERMGEPAGPVLMGEAVAPVERGEPPPDSGAPHSSGMLPQGVRRRGRHSACWANCDTPPAHKGHTLLACKSYQVDHYEMSIRHL